MYFYIYSFVVRIYSCYNTEYFSCD